MVIQPDQSKLICKLSYTKESDGVNVKQDFYSKIQFNPVVIVMNKNLMQFLRK